MYLLHLAIIEYMAWFCHSISKDAQVDRTETSQTLFMFRLKTLKSMHEAKRALRNAIPVSLFFSLPRETPLHFPP